MAADVIDFFLDLAADFTDAATTAIASEFDDFAGVYDEYEAGSYYSQDETLVPNDLDRDLSLHDSSGDWAHSSPPFLDCLDITSLSAADVDIIFEESPGGEATGGADVTLDWEEVYGDGEINTESDAVYDTDFLSMMVGNGDVTETEELALALDFDEDEDELAMWHITNSDVDPGGPAASEWEVLPDTVGHAGAPPASRDVMERLPLVGVGEVDADLRNCAVCKEEIGVEERVARLPCKHCYHGECIRPWLQIRNTCPVCRYELPTDDPVYERWRLRRAGPGTNTDANADADALH